MSPHISVKNVTYMLLTGRKNIRSQHAKNNFRPLNKNVHLIMEPLQDNIQR